MDWVSILDMMIQAWNGRVRHWNRMAQVPIRITSRSPFRNRPIMASAPKKLMTPRVVRRITATFRQNQNASRTRSYRFAPKLKPHTGWKPWPKPMRAELMNIMYLVTMDMAAMAASPKGLAATFKATAAALARPWRHNDGRPA